MQTATIKKLTPKQKLIAKLEKAGGVNANRKALKKLQDIFSSVPKPNIEDLRKAAWRMK
ncbi:MAG: hypothetical protein LC122_00885 [Chitinophagales bacterium]|nr:hypothetical protein [Chitinophagales bacterium]